MGPYQVSTTAFDCGRNIPKSKRCVKWRFGFPDEDSNGNPCRGHEHEVTLIWSVTSGKRVIKVDGILIHSSQVKRSEKLKYSWNWNGFDLDIVAYAAPPIRAREGFKLNDMKIDGKSHDCLRSICEIGCSRKVADGPEIESSSRPSVTCSSEKQDPAVQNSSEHQRENGKIRTENNRKHEEPKQMKTIYEEDDDDEISCSSSDNGLLSDEHLCSHDLKTHDINPNEPPSLEDLELENKGEERIHKCTLSYEEVWGALSNSDDEGEGFQVEKQHNPRSPNSVTTRSFGFNRKLPKNRRANKSLSAYFEKIKLGSPTALLKSPARINRKSSSYKEMDVY